MHGKPEAASLSEGALRVLWSKAGRSLVVMMTAETKTFNYLGREEKLKRCCKECLLGPIQGGMIPPPPHLLDLDLFLLLAD